MRERAYAPDASAPTLSSRAGADGYVPAVRLGDLPEPQLGYSGPGVLGKRLVRGVLPAASGPLPIPNSGTHPSAPALPLSWENGVLAAFEMPIRSGATAPWGPKRARRPTTTISAGTSSRLARSSSASRRCHGSSKRTSVGMDCDRMSSGRMSVEVDRDRAVNSRTSVGVDRDRAVRKTHSRWSASRSRRVPRTGPSRPLRRG
jgi:hypothetical protein